MAPIYISLVLDRDGINHIMNGNGVEITNTVGMMKLRNIAPQSGIKATPLALSARVLTDTSPRFPDVTILPIVTYPSY